MSLQNLSTHLDHLTDEQFFLMTTLKSGHPVEECLHFAQVAPAEFRQWLAGDRHFRAVFFHWRSLLAERASVSNKLYGDVCPYEPALPDAVVLSWYRPEDYARLRVAFADGPALPKKYEDWLALHEFIRRADTEDGCPVETVTIDLQDFSAWCRRHRCAMNAPARVLYAAETIGQKPC